MKQTKVRKPAAVIAIFLWAVVLTIVVRAYLDEGGGIPPIPAIVVFLCAAALLGWWIRRRVQVNRLVNRLDGATAQYHAAHDAAAYLSELDGCLFMPGVERAALAGMPATDYLTILKIRTLRETGRIEDSRALLEAARPGMTHPGARQLLGAEEALLPGSQLKTTP